MAGFLLLAWLALAAPADLTGIVTDPSGETVAGAAVTLTASGATRTAATGVQGTFRFAALAPGDYELTVTREGFKTVRRRVRAAAAGGKPLRIRLELADLKQQLTIAGAPDQVSTEAGENMDAVRLDRASLSQLPILGNDIVGAAAQFISAGALDAGGISMTVDGMQTSEKGVSASAIQEVRINQNPYSAEYPRPGRARIEVITKPGTPEYHGAFNFLFRDSLLDARNAFAVTRPSEQRRIFEGSLTGPIGHSRKTSFVLSGNHEEEDLQAVVFALTPTGEVRQNAPQPACQTEFSFKASRQLTEKSLLGLRYEFQDETIRGNGAGGFVLPEAAFDFTERQHHVYVNHRASFGVHWVNEFSLRSGIHNGGNTSLHPGLRKLVVNDAFTGGGAQADAHFTENHFQLTDIAFSSRGRHLVKLGVNVPDFSRRGQSDHANTSGVYSFSSLADYAAARPYSFLLQRGDGHLAFIQKEVGLFVQDEFKLLPNLLLSSGLRWDWQNYLPDHNNFAPRLALAWSPRSQPKTVLRAGGGLFYERTGAGPIGDTLRYDGAHLLRTLITNPAYPDPGPLAASQPPDLVRFARGLHEPYQLQTGFSAERQLRKSLTLAAGYTYLHGVDLFRSLDVNSPLPPAYLARPDLTAGVLREIQAAGRSRSHAFDLTLRGDVTRHFKGTMQYTCASARNDTNGINALPADSRNLAGEWARAAFDARQRLNLAGVVRPGKLLSLGLRFAWNTATPYSLTTGRDDNHDGVAADRPAGVPRNSLSGFGAATLDLRWAREFPLTRARRGEGPALGLTLDAFNALNHVNFTKPVGNLSSPFFGQPVASQPARRLQIGLEFKF